MLELSPVFFVGASTSPRRFWKHDLAPWTCLTSLGLRLGYAKRFVFWSYWEDDTQQISHLDMKDKQKTRFDVKTTRVQLYNKFFCSTFIVFAIDVLVCYTEANTQEPKFKSTLASHLFLETKNPTCSSLTRKHVFFWKVFWYPIDSLDFLEISVFYEAKNKSSTQQVEPTYVVIFHWWDKLFRHRDFLNSIWWFSQFLLFVQFCERHILAFSEPSCQSKTKAMKNYLYWLPRSSKGCCSAFHGW